MVHFASFVVTALLACSTISAAPLAGRNRKLPESDEPALINNTEGVPSNVTNVDNSTLPIANGTDVAAANVTVCDSGLNVTSTHVNNKGNGKGEGKGGAKNAAKKLAKAGKLNKNKNVNNNDTAALPPCPPANETLLNETAVLNSTAPLVDGEVLNGDDPADPEDVANPAAAKPKGKPAASGGGKVLNANVDDPADPEDPANPAATKPKEKAVAPGEGKVARIVRSLFDIPGVSRSPKRRLTPVSLWK